MSGVTLAPQLGQWVLLKGFTDGCIVPDGWHQVTEVKPKGLVAGFCVNDGKTIIWPERIAQLRDTSPDGSNHRQTWFSATRKLRDRLDVLAKRHDMSRTRLICHLLTTHPMMEDKPC